MAEGYFKDAEFGSDSLPEDSSTASTNMLAIPRVKCPSHPDRNIEMHCEDHDMVYCTLCVALDHRTCSSVKQLAGMNIKFNQPNLQELAKSVDRAFANLRQMKQRKEKQLEGLEAKARQIYREIEEFHLKLTANIEALKIKALDDLKTKGTKIYQLGKTEISQMNKVMIFLQNCKGQIVAPCNLTNIEEFIYHTMIKKSLEASQSFLTDKNYSGLEFYGNKELEALSIGEITHVNKEFSSVTHTLAVLGKGIPVVKSVRNVSVKSDNEKHCNVIEICQLPDGTLLAVDDVNQVVKRLDGHYNVRDICGGGNHLSICCTGSDQALLLSNNGSVWKLLINVPDSFFYAEKSDKLSASRFKSLQRGSYESAIRIDYVDGFLWITNDKYIISVVNTTITRSVASHNFNLKSCYQVHATYDHVYIAEGVNGILRVTTDGKNQFRMQDQRLEDARGVCTSKKGLVFVSGYKSNNIVVFDKAGTCLGELISGEKGLKNPKNLCYDTRQNCLLVCNDIVDFPVTVVSLSE